MSETFSEVEFKQTVNGLKSSIERFNNLITNVNRGEGSMGKLFKDEKLYNNLESSLGQLESLLEDLKLNPKRYVHFSLFGKKNKPYQNTDLNK